MTLSSHERSVGLCWPVPTMGTWSSEWDQEPIEKRWASGELAGLGRRWLVKFAALAHRGTFFSHAEGDKLSHHGQTWADRSSASCTGTPQGTAKPLSVLLTPCLGAWYYLPKHNQTLQPSRPQNAKPGQSTCSIFGNQGNYISCNIGHLDIQVRLEEVEDTTAHHDTAVQEVHSTRCTHYIHTRNTLALRRPRWQGSPP